MADSTESNIPLMPLGPEDVAVLDALLEARAPGGEADSLKAVPADRLDALCKVLALLDRCPAEEPSGDLTERTLAAVAEARQRLQFTQQIHALTGTRSGRGRFQWLDLVAVAAIVLFTFTLVFPALERNRESARQIAGASNLAAAGAGMSNYAADHHGAAPRGKTAPGTSWIKVGSTRTDSSQPIQSNSAHLYILVKRGYVSVSTLACPDNPNAPTTMPADAHDWASPQAVSFSYQNQYTRYLTKMDGKRMAILADKNPLFVVRLNNELTYNPDLPTDQPSFQHGQRGQNVLFTDGSVQWTVRPILQLNHRSDEDNIWTARGIKNYKGNEAPTDPGDSHLVP